MKPTIITLFFCAALSALLCFGCSEESTPAGPDGNTPDGEADSIAPAVALTSPVDGSALPALLVIAGTATDDSPIDTVFFAVRDLCGGVIWSAFDMTPPFEAQWDASGAGDGGYRVCMSAVDSAGNYSDWTCVNVTRGTCSAAITGFSPHAAYSGREITATGNGFGPDTGTGTVSVFGRAAAVSEWTDTTVTFTIPASLSADAMVGMEIVIDCTWRITGNIDITPPGVIRITTDSSSEEHPCWSASGYWIYFASTRSGNWDIWRIPAEGGEAQQVTSDPESDFTPDINPSSGELAWMSRRIPAGNYEIFKGYLPCAQGEVCTVTRVTNDNDLNRAPVWSPQVYAGYSMAFGQFYDPDDDGSTIPTIFLVSNVAIDELIPGDNPSFSPNGRWVTYQTNDYHIAKIEILGSGIPVELTEGPSDFNPDWGTANDRIVFHRYIDGYSGICVMNPDGTGLEVLLDQRYEEYDPAWSPDCSKIAFTAHRWGNFDIYVYEMP